MNQIRIFSFTDVGSRWNETLVKACKANGYACEGYALSKFAVGKELQAFHGSVTEWIGPMWGTCDFIFVGAMGIAVRAIAPYIQDKFTDSAVIVMDELGQYVIPVLSGHVGGGVALAKEIAKITAGTCVITTATDVHNKFAVDVFAAKNKMQIPDRTLAKQISASVLAGDQVGFYSEYEMTGSCPEALKKTVCLEGLESCQYGIAVLKTGNRNKIMQKESVMYLYGRDVIVGVGCRKGVTKRKLEVQLEPLLESHGLRKEQICMFASIDLKREEPGLAALADSYGVSFLTYPADRLKEVEQVSSRSAFVEKTVGVDNVCERAALLAGGSDGELLLPKTAGDEVTFAFVRKKVRLAY